VRVAPPGSANRSLFAWNEAVRFEAHARVALGLLIIHQVAPATRVSRSTPDDAGQS
jgi:hypothetical protein